MNAEELTALEAQEKPLWEAANAAEDIYKSKRDEWLKVYRRMNDLRDRAKLRAEIDAEMRAEKVTP